MGRVKELHGSPKIQKRATTKPLPPAQISGIEIPQSTQDGILKMLIRTFNHGQLRQPRPIPTKPTKTPLKTQTSSTFNQKVHQPMPRGPTTNQIQKPTNPSSLQWSVSKISAASNGTDTRQYTHWDQHTPGHPACQALYQYAKSTCETNKLGQKQPSA